MKGKHFVEIVNNQIVSQGQIEDSAGPGFWAVRFHPAQKNVPVTTRVIAAQQMQAMMMFDTSQDLLQFVKLFVEKEKGKETSPPPKIPEDMTKPELLETCKALELEIPSNASKAQLVALLKAQASWSR